MRIFSLPGSFWTFEGCHVRCWPDLSERRAWAREEEERGERGELFRVARESRLQTLYYFASEYIDVHLPRIRDILLLTCNTIISSKEVSLGYFPDNTWSSSNTKFPKFSQKMASFLRFLHYIWLFPFTIKPHSASYIYLFLFYFIFPQET